MVPPSSTSARSNTGSGSTLGVAPTSGPGRIVQIMAAVDNRGGERVLAQLGGNLRDAGFEVTHVGLVRKAPANADTEDYTMLAHGRSPLAMAAGWLRLVRLLRKTRPQAVIAHTQISALLAHPAALLAGVPRRVIVHHIAVGTNRPWIARAEALAGRSGLYTAIVFVGGSIREQVEHFPRAYQRRALVIPNAVPAPVALGRSEARRELDLDPDAFVALAVGAVSHQKNHETLVRAAATAPGVQIVIAGDGPDRPRLEALAAELGASVRFLGNVDPRLVRVWQAAADLFVFPSRYEGRSLALLEAARADMAIVASDIGENREVMGRAARYLPAEDAVAWGTALRSLAGDPDAVAALRESCRHHDVSTPERMTRAYIRLVTD
jgi:glycosyltransferase involved in cell wall biosynthesis